MSEVLGAGVAVVLASLSFLTLAANATRTPLKFCTAVSVLSLHDDEDEPTVVLVPRRTEFRSRSSTSFCRIRLTLSKSFLSGS